MADKDNTGKMEVLVRILGNELVALKMTVDDFKIKWLIYGVITICALGIYWAVIITLLDFVLHAVIDYVKRIYTLRVKLDIKSNKFWKVQAVDQMAHYSCYLFYVLMVY